jgi:hypothetical protein
MDIDDIRRTNIRALEKEAGAPKSAADRVNMTYAQYINLRDGAKDPRSGKPRGMRKETAWRFEDAFGKQRGWLDQDHSTNHLPEPDRNFIHRIEQDVARHDIPDAVKQTILMLITSSPKKDNT